MATAVIHAAKKRWTYQDYAALDDDERWEILDGELYMAPAPEFFHQTISRKLLLALTSYIEPHRLGEVVAAPLDVILDDENVVQPDLVFVASANLNVIQRHGIVGRPDMVVEIISPHSVQRDRQQKKDLYERFGIPEYWLVDAANKAIEVLTLAKGKYEHHAFAAEKGTVKSKVIPGLEIDLAQIFP
jgi:Uma2 family endonuclease